MKEIMLFPLGSVVLPEGKMRLRIFEQRYKRLVSQAMKGDGTFGICLVERGDEEPRFQLSSIGTQVQIVDFDTLSDGLLGITVAGLKRFQIRSVRTESDGLRIASVQWLPSWPVAKLEAEQEYISVQLQNVYRRFPEIGHLYQQCFFDDASWVSQRWLELLPVPNRQFDYLNKQTSCEETMRFLSSTIEK
ncbi:LON peptidase substrate-binding domain-containing protein [Vibrio sp.]|uniref:LON peptidase substrate-binding domain-containing protein n=1 Tax=Vibrio sp. TaxID=678 RepID=UPI003D0B8052